MRLSLICGHEAAHAVMAWRLGLPTPTLTASKKEGHFFLDRASPGDAVLICLAGWAWETGCKKLGRGRKRPDFPNSCTGDVLCAIDFLEKYKYLRQHFNLEIEFPKRRTDTAGRSLSRHFNTVCNILSEYMDLIEIIGSQLQISRRLSSKRLAAIIRRSTKCYKPPGPCSGL